jgi:hypothetical protein
MDDYFSCAPTDIKIMIYSRCDALTLFLNRNIASVYLSPLLLPPAPISIWVSALSMSYEGDIMELPLISRRQNHVDRYGGDADCLPDASLLCKLVKSRAMLQKIVNTRLPVPVDDFEAGVPSHGCSVHVAMRNAWLDMIDVWNMRESEKEDFAVIGSHWEYYQSLAVHRPDLMNRKHDFFDTAAANGELSLLMSLPASFSGSKSAMADAARNGHLEVVKWLHDNRSEGCTTRAMDDAAYNGHLDVIKWLHCNRTEGCSKDAMDWAARYGHLDVVKWLHANRSEGCTKYAIDSAESFLHLDVVKWLYANISEFAEYS